jgi:uncharacterized protein (DUF885 family)
MTPNRRDLLLTVAAAAIAPRALAQTPAFGFPPHPVQVADPALRHLFDDLTEAMLRDDPETATFRGLDSGPRAALKSRLDDRSWGAVERSGAHCAERLARLKAINPATLNARDKVNYETVAYALELGVGGSKFPYGDNTLTAAMNESAGPYVVNQQAGDFNTVPEFLATQHTINTKADADAYLSRLQAFATALDQETDRVRRDAGHGVVAPNFILDTCLTQMSDFRAKPATSCRLVGSLVDRVRAKGIPGDYDTAASKIVADAVYPALDRQIAALRAVRTHATSDAGVWKLPDGEAYYAWLLKTGTTTPLTAAEIHKTGLEQVDAIGARMDELLQKQGLTQGSVGARMKALGEDPKNLFPNTDAGRAQIIAYLNGRLAAVRQRMPQAFNIRLKANVVIKRVPADIQAGAPLGYENDGSIDGSRPATYYINLQDTANWPRFSLPTLTYHEAIPGHVWQGAYVEESQSLPLIRSILSGFNAYVEGWALYSEQLADELGMYDDDPLGRLGYLQEQRFRACRLVVDTGLHAMRWSRDKAIAYLVDTNGEARGAMQSEVDRYCASPGQACGYKVGHNAINTLRDRARSGLGPRYRLQDFDDVVVETAGVPLTVLNGVVERYIASKRA